MTYERIHRIASGKCSITLHCLTTLADNAEAQLQRDSIWGILSTVNRLSSTPQVIAEALMTLPFVRTVEVLDGNNGSRLTR